jgi:hypothetical protein
MNPTRTHIGPAVQLREVRLKGRVSSIFFSFAVSLAIFFLAALLMAGRSRLLEHAATMKPYAVAYRPTALPATAEPGSDAQRLVIFLGDSSVAQAPWAREDVPGIPDLLQQVLSESLPQARTALVADWSFAGARPFHYYCLLFEAEKHDPSLLIMPINWRSIGPLSDEWNKAFAFPELSSLVPAPERSMPSSEEMMRVEGISHSAQVLSAAHRPMLYATGVKALILSNFLPTPPSAPQIEVLQALPPGEHLIERYSDARLFRQYSPVLDDGSASLRALRLIVETAERRGVRVLFYITPIHLDELRSRSSFDIAAFRTSVEGITAASTSGATMCLDLSGLLSEDEFLDNYEHYTREGNTRIARALAPAVAKSLGR